MSIQAELFFSQSEVICVPLDPKLAEYRDRLALEDPALTFRMRLFGARVRMAEPSARVALVLPVDCVLRAADAGARAAGQPDFDGIPEEELHILTGGAPDRPCRLAVERSAFDEVIAFARAYGLTPVSVLIPDPEGDGRVSVPVPEAEPPQDAPQAPRSAATVATSSLAMPPALERELRKRKKQEDARNSRAPKPWSLGKFLGGAPESGTQELGDLAPSARPDMATRQAAIPAAPLALQAEATNPSEATVTTPAHGTISLGPTEDQPGNRRTDGAFRLPHSALSIGLAASVALVAFGGMLLFAITRMDQADVTLVAEQTGPQPRVQAEIGGANAPSAAVAASAPPERAGLAPQADRIARTPEAAPPESTPDLVTSSASLPHAGLRTAQAVIPAPRHRPPSIDALVPMILQSPELATSTATTLPPNGALGVDDGPTRFAVAFPPEPAMGQLLPPVIGDTASGGIRRLAAPPARDLPRPDPAPQAEALGPLALAAPGGQSAAPSPVPTPRPTARREDQPSLVTRAPAISPLETARLLGPAQAPRPIVRPSPSAPAAESVAAAPTVDLPVATNLAEAALTPEVNIAQGPVPGLRVLAIVGSGADRQALVQTGPNQTAVLVAGSATRRWRVLEVRRDGIVLDINGRQRLLPIGL